LYLLPVTETALRAADHLGMEIISYMLSFFGKIRLLVSYNVKMVCHLAEKSIIRLRSAEHDLGQYVPGIYEGGTQK
jgi:hypothetical protein